MKVFFILGSQSALSIAEIATVIAPHPIIDAFTSWAIAKMPENTDLSELMTQLGGVVKVGTIVEPDLLKEADLEERIAAILEAKPATRSDFGISIYAGRQTNVSSHAAVKSLGMNLKKACKERGMPCRWVAPQQGLVLSSVTVAKNKLTESGTEIVLIPERDLFWLGVTAAVQPFEEFSEADYGRPARDMNQGMLPPKLARIMLNIADITAESVVADPFCGSGTILTEALQLGVTTAYASDKNKDAIVSTEKNLVWIAARGQKQFDGYTIFHSDSRHIGQHIPLQSVDAVVTEPFLGPTRSGREMRGDLQRTLDQLALLYADSLRECQKVLKPGGTVVMILPIYIMQNEKHGVTLDFAKLGYTTIPLVAPNLMQKIKQAETKRHGLIYGRPGQLVWREIVKLVLK